MNTFDDALKYLDWLCVFGVKEGLERINAMTAALGEPQNFYRTVHVAGTNGKGSVSAMLAEILRTAGFRVGLFTSPHLESYCERIKVNGVNISETEFAEEIFRVKDCNVDGTHFEVLTAAAFDYFRRRGVDIAVIEVGLGGTYDSTNVITPAVSVITNVARDHENILGDLDNIARNKAGIIKPNVPCVTGATGRPLEIIRRVAEEKNSPLHVVTKAFDGVLNLRGDYQRMNAATAIETARLLHVDDEKIFAALERVTWAGRFEVQANMVIDGAHNPHGATALRKSLDENFPDGRRAWLFGVLDDKDFDAMIEILFRRDDVVFVTEPPSERAASCEKICGLLRERGITCTAFKDNFEAARNFLTMRADVKVAAGSLYLIGNVRQFLLDERKFYEAVQRLTLMDDIFFAAVFSEDDGTLTAFILKIILGRELKIISVKVQDTLQNLHGRSVRLDVHAISEDGEHVNIEIQRQSSGAVPKRARYNSSVLDASILSKGEDFAALPETYVIFITERDVLKLGEPIYRIERVIVDRNKPFGDGSHIIYVNGSIKDETPLGRLMHDFACVNPYKIFYGEILDRVKPYKIDEEKVTKMTGEIKEMFDREAEQLRRENEQLRRTLIERTVETAKKMIKRGKLTLEEIADDCGLSLEEVQALAAK